MKPSGFPFSQFSRSVMSNSLQPHGLQHARPPCPPPTPRVYSNSCPLSQWSRPTNPSSVTPFSSYPQSFPASGSFQMSQFFASGGQSIGTSASASVLPMSFQDWFALGLTGLILLSKGLSRVFSDNTIQKHQFSGAPCTHTLYRYIEQFPAQRAKKILAVLLLSTSSLPLPLKKLHWVLKDGVWTFFYDLGHRNVTEQMTNRLWGKNIYRTQLF